MSSGRLIFASANNDKLAEVKALISEATGNQFEIQGYQQVLPDFTEIEESGSTIEENALIKAQAIFDETGIPVFADDTGLEVDALGGAPGVYSARYAGENVTYLDNVNKLLREMEGVGDRAARFRTVIAYISASGVVHYFEGIAEGKILTEPRGSSGFGYDPIFSPAEFPDRTFAEMTLAEKNHMSHRGRALKKFLKFLPVCE